MLAKPEVIYIDMATVGASILDPKTLKPWTAQRAKRWLQRSDACVKRNGRWVTTVELLKESFPEIYHRIQMEMPE